MIKSQKIECISLKVMSVLLMLVSVFGLPYMLLTMLNPSPWRIFFIILLGLFPFFYTFMYGFRTFISTNNPAQKYNIFTFNRRWSGKSPSGTMGVVMDIFEADEEDHKIIDKKIRKKRRKKNLKELLDE